MECHCCGAELINTDWYGHKVYGEHYWIESHWEKDGDIFTCPNAEGFEEKEEAVKHIRDMEGSNEYQGEDWEDMSCYSSTFNGHFYTDSSGNLNEGYPC